MFVSIKLEKLLRALIILVLLAIATVFVISLSKGDRVETYADDEPRYVLILDPGHGGIDGGAVSADGVKESDINLSIALKMRTLSDFLGVETVMTRETDTDNSVGGSYSEHNNLLARAELANSVSGGVLISIHQNTYPSPQPKGAETIYAASNESKRLGIIAQDDLVAVLDRDNRRVARPAPESLLLTSSVKCPAILVECGFMSNPDELTLLRQDGYQLKIAFALMCSFLRFSDENI